MYVYLPRRIFSGLFIGGFLTKHFWWVISPIMTRSTRPKNSPDFWIRFTPARTKSDRGVVTTDGGRTPRRGGQYAQNDDGATRV